MPIATVPSKNWTVPEGFTAAVLLEVMVTVSVTVFPRPEFTGLTVSVEVVSSLATVTTTGAELLPPKLASPWYWAVIELVPPGMVLVTKVATPLITAAVPSGVVPLMKMTLPVGVPVPLTGATVAVSVTVCTEVDRSGGGGQRGRGRRARPSGVLAAEVLAVKLPSPW